MGLDYSLYRFLDKIWLERQSLFKLKDDKENILQTLYALYTGARRTPITFDELSAFCMKLYNILNQNNSFLLMLPGYGKEAFTAKLFFSWIQTILPGLWNQEYLTFFSDSFYSFFTFQSSRYKYKGRIYLNVKKEYVLDVFEYVIRKLGEKTLVHLTKVIGPAYGNRFDSIIIWVKSMDCFRDPVIKTIFNKLAEYQQDHVDHFEDSAPLLCKKINSVDNKHLKGVAFATSSVFIKTKKKMSYGQTRLLPIVDALIDIFQRYSPDSIDRNDVRARLEFRNLVRQKMVEQGINPHSIIFPLILM